MNTLSLACAVFPGALAIPLQASVIEALSSSAR